MWSVLNLFHLLFSIKPFGQDQDSFLSYLNVVESESVNHDSGSHLDSAMIRQHIWANHETEWICAEI